MGEGVPASSNSTTPQPPTSHKMSWVNHVGRALVTTPAGPLLFTCVCLAIAYKKMKKPPTRVLHRSMSMAALHGGRVAMQRIIDAAKVRTEEAVVDNAMRQMQTLLAQRPLSFSELQRAAARLEMSGKEDEAVDMLQKAWEKADKEGLQHEAHELQMLLVEMLIYKGEYPKALGCKCLQDKEILDARGPLYKAVAHTILNERKKAEDYYKGFQKIQSLLYDLPDSFQEGSLEYKAMHDFNKFVEIVENLKKEIEQAHKAK